jgi:hypothetical protein
MSNNPLQNYFRKPSIYVRLPSGGEHYPDGALEVTENGEYPVLPMTTLDEITYRTPDALFNGQAVVSVIQSCVPNIKDAWKVPGMDVDTLLIAIRIATYGHQMDISTKCPACNTDNDYGVDLRGLLDQIKSPDYTQPMTQGDLEIFFTPMSYKQMNDNNLVQFEEQRALQALNNPEVSEQQRARALGEALTKITSITTRALAQNIKTVKTPHALVNDPKHIMEWLSNCDRQSFNRIRDYIIENKRVGEIPPLKLKCNACSTEYDQPITLDMANFFEDAS